MSELRSNPYPGEIWHHWMHRPDRPLIYRILTITVADIGMEVTLSFECFIQDAYNNRQVVLHSAPEIPGLCWLTHEDCLIQTPHVIFKQLDTGIIWATTFNAFMAPNENSPTGWKYVRTPYNGL